MKSEKAAILGIGIEGLALYDFLVDKVEKLAVHDLRTKEEILEKADPENIDKVRAVLDDPRVEKILGQKYLDNLNAYDVVYRSPSVYFNDEKILALRAGGVKVSSQIGLFMELCPAEIIGVTGTKGKGTTASLIYEIMKKNIEFLISNVELNPKSQIPNPATNVFLAGNIGYPAITLIPQLKKEDVVILELSNFQLADLGKSPHIAVMTNLGIDHLDYHKDVEEYHNAKKSMFGFQNGDDFAVLNIGSTFDKDFISGIKSKICYFSGQEDEKSYSFIGEIDGKLGVFLRGENGDEKCICREDEINLLGKHNLENIAAAAIVADILQVDHSIISDVAKNFEGLPHRLQIVTEINGIKFINDSFATNPGPTIAAINSFSDNKILILGGSSKGADFSELAREIKNGNVKGVVLIGDEGEKIMESLEKVNYKGMVHEAGYSLKDAVNLAKVEAKVKNCKYVIFSPACASFDMFKNYKKRGELFKKAVLEMINETN